MEYYAKFQATNSKSKVTSVAYSDCVKCFVAYKFATENVITKKIHDTHNNHDIQNSK